MTSIRVNIRKAAPDDARAVIAVHRSAVFGAPARRYGTQMPCVGMTKAIA